jgi:hypothetical protein
MIDTNQLLNDLWPEQGKVAPKPKVKLPPIEINKIAKPKFSCTMSHPIGSRYICSPPPMDTDIDTLFLVPDLEIAQQALEDEGWICDAGDAYDLNQWSFISMRKGENNYILTDQFSFYEYFVLAADVCKHLNITSKNERIWVHHKLLSFA